MIRPFSALRPTPQLAAEVVAPPYDVVSFDEARALAQGKPWSFLHISRPEIDLPPGTDPYSGPVYAKARENLDRMRERGILERDPAPHFYAYRMVMDGHVQTGLVGAASIAAYDQGRIRRHELTRPGKEDDRVRQIEALNAQTGPVLLAYPDCSEVDELLNDAAKAPPEIDVTASGGVRHMLWTIADETAIRRFAAAFEAMAALYIGDGHHRSAAASRVAASRGTSARDGFLCVAFPQREMRILPYNRLVRDLKGMDRSEFLRRVSASFRVALSAKPVSPERQGVFGLYLPGQWYRLEIDQAAISTIAGGNPVASLDVSLLADKLLDPILGIIDPRTDPRIDFVGGIRGLEELERRVESGMAAALSMHPTSMHELMEVADAGHIMPPKSTWFEPKLADGLVSLVLD